MNVNRTLFWGAALAVACLCAVVALSPDMLSHFSGHALDHGYGLAMTCAPALNKRARGLVGVRLDASDATKILAELQKTFESFKAENEAELKALKKDVVQTEKVDKINAEITKLTTALAEIDQTIAALKLGGGSAAPDPTNGEHAKAFNRYFRKGDAGNLGELQVKAALTTQSDPDGGYLVPTETEKTIDRIMGVTSTMRQLATILPIGTSEYKKLVNMGGAGSGWVGEEEARPQTGTPTLRELIFTVMELYANPATTRTMLDDGIIDIGAWLADEVNITFAEQEGAAFVTGNGLKRPRGILAYPTVANANYSWGNVGYVVTGAASDFLAPTSTVSPADALLDLLYGLKQGYRNNASYLSTDATMAKIRKFKDGQGNYVWAPPSANEKVPTIFGKPAYTDDNMNEIGTNTFPVAVGDFKRAYLIVDRQGVRVLRDELTNKPYVHFYTTKRVGGGISNFEAIKLLKCST
ncbi:phage major capsid protein [Mesorhizobium japonicum]|uniref:Phage major capsid protein GP36 n=1 Tax=Mesorhizobium japonicum (strain LMG 29417 / CECT 9101 / MAFF 303099) TaxID=266835 RepID=Q982R8_RHILO|nr:phage major capsid protein [Mesorhizobium japonicum]BAB54388.1 phage major capsid protein; GP36 [Mesorhizobium japonicum MAFF 303099]